MFNQDASVLRRRITGGVAAGVAGGLALALSAVTMGMVRGIGAVPILKLPAAGFLGTRVLTGGFDAGAVVLGLVTHFGLSLFWGIAFALLFDALTRSATVIAGLAFGFFVWLAMFYFVLPLVGLAQITATEPVGLTLLAHTFFGLGLALGYMPYQQRPPVVEEGPVTA